MTLQSPPSPRKDWSYDKYFQSQIQKNKNDTETSRTNRHQSTENHRSPSNNQAKTKPRQTLTINSPNSF